MSRSKELIESTNNFIRNISRYKFSSPVTHIYNPLEYAIKPHIEYINKFGNSKKKSIFMGMNPGPWGMAQTGIPFGEVNFVKNWMKINSSVKKPKIEHPKRPILGFNCSRSEVSGNRFWKFFSDLFINPDDFFKFNYVVNYCPIIWMEESGKNRTPDKIPLQEIRPLLLDCDNYIVDHINILRPNYLVGVGVYAQKRLEKIKKEIGNDYDVEIIKIMHPSPANPKANKEWFDVVKKQLEGII